MRAQAALSILAVLAVALSGCASDDPDVKPLDTGSPTSSTDGGNETADGNTTQEPANGTTAPNTPPTAELSASTVNGTAPLNVTFTLDGSDADGDDLSWTFTVGNVTEEGTALPATVDVTLEAGNHTATLTVSDGENETVASVVVSVAGADAPSAVVQEAAVTWSLGNGGCGASYDAWVFGTPANGVTHAEVALADGTAGLPYRVEAAKAVVGIGFVGFDFYDPDGFLVEPGNFAFASTLSADGVVPAGAAYVLFNDCSTEGTGTASIVIG